jgi:hypothetical protein
MKQATHDILVDFSGEFLTHRGAVSDHARVALGPVSEAALADRTGRSSPGAFFDVHLVAVGIFYGLTELKETQTTL